MEKSIVAKKWFPKRLYVLVLKLANGAHKIRRCGNGVNEVLSEHKRAWRVEHGR
jgi:hypothetical protein